MKTLEHILKCKFDGENQDFLRFQRQQPHKIPAAVSKFNIQKMDIELVDV